MADTRAPFVEGQIVRIKGNDHLGPHRITSCEWYEPFARAPYWLCECEEEARLYIDAGCPMNAKWTEHPKYVAWRQKQSVAA